ncbi:phage head morphogenesis protein [Klebsiella pneumoniae]
MATSQSLIHWPTQNQKPKSPVIPRSKVDPTMSRKSVSKMERDIEARYYSIKVALKALFDQRLTGREREVNSHNWHFLCHYHGEDVRLYQVNAGKFIYDMSAQELADLLEAVQSILDDYLLEGGEQNLWAMDYVVAEAQRGTLEAFNNLSQQSQVYASQTTLSQLLSSPGYLNQISAARLTTFSDWKVISDTARGDLTNIITDAVARGVNPRETASVISKRLDVSMSKAKTIAQTEQVGALRQAQWNETDWAADRLGLNTGLLWLSALKPTTRTWHASRHGKVYTTEQVRDFYAENGNRYNCYCSQIPVLLNDDGSIFNEGLADKLAKERKQWTKAESA